MSELIVSAGRKKIGKHLLTTVSAMALLGFQAGLDCAAADGDADRPTVWVELGTQLERSDGSPDRFSPDFVQNLIPDGLVPLSEFQRPARYAIGGEGKIEFSPERSNWVFSAAVRYGRSNKANTFHSSTKTPITTQFTFFGQHLTGAAQPNFETINNKQHESHFVLDFSAGRDVGVGLSGRSSNTVIQAGIRLAQFTAGSTSVVTGHPTNVFKIIHQQIGPFLISFPGSAYHTYFANWSTSRSFSGIGPELSWRESIAVAGTTDDGQLSFDWSLNGAVLFGRQKAQTHQNTATRYSYHVAATQKANTWAYETSDSVRSRSVVVPNVGGSVGLSMRYSNAKISLGYRGDFFFGAMDGGIASRKSYDRNFYGPFATISFGLGG